MRMSGVAGDSTGESEGSIEKSFPEISDGSEIDFATHWTNVSFCVIRWVLPF